MSDTQKEINIDLEKLVSAHEAWAADEKDANSDAGTRRQQIGQLAEDMGLENKAMSQFRAGLKIAKREKRMAWVRSLEELLPIARNLIFGNEPEMELEPAEEDTVAQFKRVDTEEDTVAAE